MLFAVDLNCIAVVRAITPRHAGLRRANSVIISSVSPSLKYSYLSPVVRFSNGKTTNMSLWTPLSDASDPPHLTGATNR